MPPKPNEEQKHYHEALYQDEKLTDECARCGKNIRDEVHVKEISHSISADGWCNLGCC